MDYLPISGQVLKNIRKHLEDNTLFVFDFWYGPAVLRILPSERIKIVQSDDIKIIRTPIDKSIRFEELLSKSYFNIMDSASKKWSKHLYPVLEELVDEIDFQAMYVTAPPFSIANLGVKVSKRFNIPLVLDMRDHWSHWNITPFTSYLHYRLILSKESEWFQHASAVLAVSEQMIEDLKGIVVKKIEV